LRGDYKRSEYGKVILPNEAFGAMRITVERPLRLRWEISEETLPAVEADRGLAKMDDEARGKLLSDLAEYTGIRAAFEPYYGETVAPPTDPNLLYDTRRALDEYGVLRPEEVFKVATLLSADESRANHARIHAALAPAIDRFHALEAEEQEAFRDALARFARTYSFLSQIVSFTDTCSWNRPSRALSRWRQSGASSSPSTTGRDVSTSRSRRRCPTSSRGSTSGSD
jgi:hypothetical protein